MSALSDIKNLHRAFSTHPLTSKAPLRAWSRFATWQLRSRLKAEILVDWVGGQKLAVRHGMTGATGNIYLGLHEFFEMAALLHFLRQDDLFLDVGANVGTYTVLASGVCRAKTYAFEPDPDARRSLKRNVDINQLEHLVRVHDCAVGAAKQEVPFTVGLDTQNRLATSEDASTRIVHMETLDDIVQNSNPVMMKIDVEGWGMEVLSGASRVLANPSLNLLELEYAGPDCTALLSHHGFEAAWYDRFDRTLSRGSGTGQHDNTVFVRNWQFVADRLQSAPKVHVLGKDV
jgi:FkbM family methyltransferase